MRKEAAGEKTYILETTTGIRHVKVPATWKLTFGPTAPYNAKSGLVAQQWSLRFYEGAKENLRAIFTDVVAFRDQDIKILERRTETERRVIAQEGGGGGKNVVVTASVTRWVDPDADEQVDANNERARALLTESATAASAQAQEDTNLLANLGEDF